MRVCSELRESLTLFRKLKEVSIVVTYERSKKKAEEEVAG